MIHRHGKHHQGFTLLELLVVVVVIGILASLAVPRFLKTIEKARIAEAKNVLGEVRSSEFRYRLDNAAYTTCLAALDVDNPNNATPRYYNYVVVTTLPTECSAPSASTEPFWGVATRVSTEGRPAPPPGVSNGYKVILGDSGNLCDNLP